MARIIIGTSNPSKIREIASILSPLGHEIIPCAMDIDETGKTLQENAEIKALAYSKAHPGDWVIAEDSGIMCANIVSQYCSLIPGPYSARFHSIDFDILGIGNDGKMAIQVTNVPHEEFTTDKAEHDKLNNEALISLVKLLPEDKRQAYFGVCFAVAKDGEVLKCFNAHAAGKVITEMHGENGFGYDPIFIGDDSFGKTYAELDSARKNLRSHRRKALKLLGEWVEENIHN